MENMRLIFDKVGVFERKPNEGSSLDSFKTIISKVYRDTSDPLEQNIYILASDDDEDLVVYPADLDDVEVDEQGNIHFELYDAKYTIRGLTPEDGRLSGDSVWTSLNHKYKMDMPVQALEYMLNPNERSSVMANTRELLTAYSKDDKSGPIFGVEYLNSNLGSFIRSNGLWILLSPEDETFDDMYITVIDPEKADKFLEAFDKGGMTVEEADTYADPSPEYQV